MRASSPIEILVFEYCTVSRQTSRHQGSGSGSGSGSGMTAPRGSGSRERETQVPAPSPGSNERQPGREENEKDRMVETRSRWRFRVDIPIFSAAPAYQSLRILGEDEGAPIVINDAGDAPPFADRANSKG